MAKCTHIAGIQNVTPSALGCEECLKTGDTWLHLRICRTCGHVGCCDDLPNKHATKHFHATQHPIIEGYDPPEGWGWCYVDEAAFDLSDRKTPHNGRIRAITENVKRLVGRLLEASVAKSAADALWLFKILQAVEVLLRWCAHAVALNYFRDRGAS